MSRSELTGKVQTVLGPIAPEDLGITLPHEHLISDGSCWFVEPSEATEKAMVHHPVTLDILWWLRYHLFQNMDDLLLLDEQEAIKEAIHFKLAGGNSIVELSNIGLGRDPAALARISRSTGLNVIMGSGYYLAVSHGPEMDAKTEEEITDEIVRDIMVGAGNSGIRSGIIGEIGCSWPLADNERKSLRAAARAQQLTGAALNVHPGQGEEAAMEIVKILGDAGADLTRTV
ncbi:MAG: phosphotriesterase-related protein, partial [Dehalococcoidia bacterium]|nr:phosphotriesterase-related protein [Dehalococcoidia bacterium]